MPKMVKGILTILTLLVIALLIWHLALPAVVVLSFVPQFSKPPIDFVTQPPLILALRPNLDRYEPNNGRAKANLILFHAANEKGKDDPRLQRLATVFARTGLRVYVPTLENLNREKFHPEVLEEIRSAINYVINQNPGLSLKIVSFSVGVGPVLIVAAEDDIDSNIDLLLAFGGYYDLKNIVAFHTTGQGPSSAKATAGRQDPFGTWLLARYFAQFLEAPDSQIFYQIADRKWQDLNADISDLAGNLGNDGHKTLALLENKNPDATSKLIAELPQELKNFFAVFDPEPHLPNLDTEVLLLHSIHDPVIPFTESEKLLAELRRENKKARLIELQVFDHVNLTLPPLTFKNFFTLYLPEFWRLYGAVRKIIS